LANAAELLLLRFAHKGERAPAATAGKAEPQTQSRAWRSQSAKRNANFFNRTLRNAKSKYF
jgi:hypothetical protein